MAIQNAFADLNSDVAAAKISCPSGATCPVSPLIYASAFAQASFSGVSTATTGTSPYTSNYGSDYYPYFGQMTVQNEHQSFPISTATGVHTVQLVHKLPK